ncbi:hypothetical protein [Kangiella aquimarina]|uniref:Uncharacterized protein n=1 Tax=Kangiella aquimarina TaxID=261965 RepID=A0ABZ0X2D6_9GAMM|nr:hypothetical protein [Kangiella aquimarina]WQG84534.1 hypothetical protein SR900_08650 [Kangiella aquimarina]
MKLLFCCLLFMVGISQAGEKAFIKIDLGDPIITEMVLENLKGKSIDYIQEDNNIILVDKEMMPQFEKIYNESIQKIIPAERTQTINSKLLENYKEELIKADIKFKQVELEGHVYLLLDRAEDFMESNIIKYQLYEDM